MVRLENEHVTEIFFSYKSEDRDRVKLVHDALEQQGFDVFWDQKVPANVDWDIWIRRHLAEARCAIVFWSATSAKSDNVRHEATIARQQGKLIAALLEPLTVDQFPMGLYAQQGVNFSDWNGDLADAEWLKLRREVELKLTPRWLQQKMDELEADIAAERARREGAESRDRSLLARIAKEAQAQQELKIERDRALEDTADLKIRLDELIAKHAAVAAAAEPESKRLADVESKAQQLEQHNREIAALLSTTEQAKIRAEQQHAAEASRVATLTAELDTARERASQAEAWQREVPAGPRPRLASAGGWRAALGFGAIGAALAASLLLIYQQFSTEMPRNSVAQVQSSASVPPSQVSVSAPAAPPIVPSATVASASGRFTIRTKTEAFGSDYSDPAAYVPSIGQCEQKCAASAKCNVFTFNPSSRGCFFYVTAGFKPNSSFDSGVKNK
jgi:TIR domain-containing protein/PAN domain-containing protein